MQYISQSTKEHTFRRLLNIHNEIYINELIFNSQLCFLKYSNKMKSNSRAAMTG